MAEGSWIRIGALDAHLDAKTVNSIIEKALGQRAVSVTQTPEVRRRVGEAYLEVVTPFVPKSNKPTAGQLRDSGRATDDGRVYWTAVGDGVSYDYNYASHVYDEDSERWGPEGYKKPTTEGTVPRWTEKVQPHTKEWEVFVSKVATIVKEAFRDE